MEIEVKESRDKTGVTLTLSSGAARLLLVMAANELAIKAQEEGIVGEMFGMFLTGAETALVKVKRIGAGPVAIEVPSVPVVGGSSEPEEVRPEVRTDVVAGDGLDPDQVGEKGRRANRTKSVGTTVDTVA